MDNNPREAPANAPPAAPPRPDATHPQSGFYRPQRPSNGSLGGNDTGLPNVAPAASYLKTSGGLLIWAPAGVLDDWE